jgi:tetratricopeptide (TPR) repeat protein
LFEVLETESHPMKTIVLESTAPATVIIDDLDRADEDRLDEAHLEGTPPSHLPSFRGASLEHQSPSHSAISSRILARLLSMADSYRESGSLRQAIEIYFELMHEHSETPQAERAEERLFDVARSYERAGELRQARGIYEQLL